MSAEHEFDVVIAGAGMAGATLALGLTQAGFRVAVVDIQTLETRTAPDFDGRASAIAYANFRQWRALGVAGALEPHAQPLRSIMVTDGPAPGASARSPSPTFLRFDSAEIADRNDGEPLAWMIENRHIRAAVGQAVEAAGVDVFAPARVESVETDARLARVRLADGRVLTAPLVVGAEGRVSPVREAAGLRTTGWRYAQDGVVATVALAHPHEGVAHEYFMGGAALAILPLTENRASLVWNEPRAQAKALVEASPEAFEAHLARRFGDALGAPRLIGPRFRYPLALTAVEKIVAERTALVGDAAHVMHPIAGQGLNMGLKDAAALAEVVADAARLGEDWGGAVVLDRYARWRRFDTAGMGMATDLVIRLFGPTDPVSRAVRGAGMKLMGRAAPLRRLFMQEAGGALGDLPRLLRGEALTP
ncbi:MAG: 2-octaprenyl-6-methoxyphenyl hydroxylase [Caulobacterales bacterium 32-69-10]|nr:MAG: 2-octaprenyl-6-methoxyphenyl hydroxylase [Caulobacterales bacterium 32-69-10]